MVTITSCTRLKICHYPLGYLLIRLAPFQLSLDLRGVKQIMIEHRLVILIRGHSILNEKLISNECILDKVLFLDFPLLDSGHTLVCLPFHLLLSVEYLQSFFARRVLCCLVVAEST